MVFTLDAKNRSVVLCSLTAVGTAPAGVHRAGRPGQLAGAAARAVHWNGVE